jgi:hypothetical protein
MATWPLVPKIKMSVGGDVVMAVLDAAGVVGVVDVVVRIRSVTAHR